MRGEKGVKEKDGRRVRWWRVKGGREGGQRRGVSSLVAGEERRAVAREFLRSSMLEKSRYSIGTGNESYQALLLQL